MNLRIKNLAILFLCVLKFIFSGKAAKKVSNPKRFLIFQTTSNLGDMVFVTPMLRAIKVKYPQSKVYLVAKERGREILRYNKDIDEYIVYTNNIFKLIKKIRKEKIDFATTMNPGILGILYLSGIPSISAFSPSFRSNTYSRSHNFLTKFLIGIQFQPGVYIPKQNLKLLEPLGIYNQDDQDARPHLFFSKEAESKVLKVFSRNNINLGIDLIAAIAPGGSADIRWWGRDKFAALADYLFQKYNAKIFLIGAGSDKKPIEEMISFMDKKTPYVNLLNQPLDEFKSFLSKVNLIIGNDSGPMTIAKAFDIPSMVFIGPTDEREYHFSGPLNRIVKSNDRGKPLTNSLNWTVYDEKEARRQMDEITLEQAIQELNILMQNLSKNL